VREVRLTPRLASVVGDSGLLEPTAETRERFGSFTVVLYQTAGEAREEVIGDPADEDGLTWKRDRPERGPQVEQISAVKAYDNVVLRWEPDESRVDDRWRSLDAALGAATSGRRAP
jgi:hypothetical protein